MDIFLKVNYLLVPGMESYEAWIGDGPCDDINNNKNSSFDEGDCCGNNAVNQYCFDCSCLSMSENTFTTKFSKKYTFLL